MSEENPNLPKCPKCGAIGKLQLRKTMNVTGSLSGRYLTSGKWLDNFMHWGDPKFTVMSEEVECAWCMTLWSTDEEKKELLDYLQRNGAVRI